MSQPQERKKRSVTLLKRSEKSKKNQPLQVEFNEFCQSIGDNQGKFGSYCGVETRTMISILIPAWNKVPNTEKDQLWLTIKNHWNIEDDKCKAQVLKSCNESWKAYKKRLVREFLKKGKDPVKVYPYLDETTWQQFVALKSKKEFMEKSNKGRENARKNTNPVRLGSRGYRGMKPQWDKERESGESTSEILQIENERTRDYLMGRRKRIALGVYVLPSELQPLAEKLIEKDVEASQGYWVPGLGEDPLINVLGPEHPGRTRAVGCNVGLRQGIQGINEKKRKIRNKEYMDEMVLKAVEDKMKQLKAELRSDMEVQMQTIIQQMMSRNNDRFGGSLGVTKSSCDSTQAFDELDEIQSPTRCDLVLPYGAMKNKCAMGMVYLIGNGEIHLVPLLPDHMKVMIDQILLQFQYMPLPVPTEEMSTLVEARSSFVQWPRKAIVLTQVSQSTHVPREQEQSSPIVACDGPSTRHPVPAKSASTFDLVQQRKQHGPPKSLQTSKGGRQKTTPKQQILKPKTLGMPSKLRISPCRPEQLAEDLELLAHHAGQKSVNMNDVILSEATKRRDYRFMHSSQ